MKIDVIIPLCNLLPISLSERLLSLDRALHDFYAMQSADVQVILVEQSLDGKYPYLDAVVRPDKLKCEAVSLQYPIFNKCWCINAGVRVCRGDLVIIADSDMYCRDSYLEHAGKWFRAQGLKWAFAWDKLLYTTDEEKKTLITGQRIQHPAKFGKRFVLPARGYSEGGLVMFDVDFFWQIGGANEWLQELGGPDNELSRRAEWASTTYEMYPQTVYHLTHPQRPKGQRPTRKENKRVYHSVVTSTHAAVKFLRKNRGGGVAPKCSQLKWFL